MDNLAQVEQILVEIDRLKKEIAKALPALTEKVEEWETKHGGSCQGNCGQAVAGEDYDRGAQQGKVDWECCAELNKVQSLLHDFDSSIKALGAKIRWAVEELDRVMLVWKQWEQKRKICRVENPVSLNILQRQCFEKLLPLILNWKTYAQAWTELAKKVPNDFHRPIDLAGEAMELVSRLLNQAFVVIQQPAHGLRRGSMNPVPIVALLIDTIEGLEMSFSQVSTSVLWEDQAQQISLGGSRPESVMPLRGSEVLMNTGEKSGTVLPGRWAYFGSLQLLSVVRKRREETRGFSKCKGPIESMHYMLFETVVKINGGKERGGLEINCRTLSFPIAAFTHGSQVADTDGHVMWYYAFGVMQPWGWISPPPTEVPWGSVMEIISSRFDLELGKRLENEEHIACLRERLLGPEIDDDNGRAAMVTVQQFCLSKLHWRVEGREGWHDFSFWTWVYQAMMAISRTNLRTLWGMEGSHSGFGFIRLETAEALLTGRPGIYLIRFSNSQLGGISVSVARHGGSVCHMIPLERHCLNESVLDYLRDVQGCDFLHPNIRIQDRFEDRYTPPRRRPDPSGTSRYEALVISVPQLPPDLVMDEM